MVGFDKSNASKAALEEAKKQAKAFGAGLCVITSMVGGREVPRDDFATAERELEQVSAALKAENIPCETHLLVRGLSPGEDMVKFAKEKEMDMIVVGVRKRSKVGKILLGSTAQYVIIKAPCPVLTVK